MRRKRFKRSKLSWKRSNKPSEDGRSSQNQDERFPFGIPRSIRDDLNRNSWAESRPYCIVCWIPYEDTFNKRFPAGIQTHEIVGGSMRSLEPCNYAGLCSKCHDEYHSRKDGIEFEDILGAKWEATCMEAGLALPFRSVVFIDGEEAWNPYRLSFLRRPQRTELSLSALPNPRQASPLLLLERQQYRRFLSTHSGLTESQFLSHGTRFQGEAGLTFPLVTAYIASSGGLESCLSRAGKLEDWTKYSSLLSASSPDRPIDMSLI